MLKLKDFSEGTQDELRLQSKTEDTVALKTSEGYEGMFSLDEEFKTWKTDSEVKSRMEKAFGTKTRYLIVPKGSLK